MTSIRGAWNATPWWLKVAALGAAGVALKETYDAIFEANIEGDVVVITGAGSGIGRALAVKLAALGCHLALCDIDFAAVQAVVSEIRDAGGDARAYQTNVMLFDDVQGFAQRVLYDFGRVDVLVNNAGILSGRLLSDLSDMQIARTFGVNIASHFWTTKAFLPGMIRRKSGHIVTMCSASALCGVAGLTDYAASKWAAFGFNESLRMELKKIGASGVTTSVVCPYFTRTPLISGIEARRGRWILPVMEVDYVAARIVTAIKRRQPQLFLPGHIAYVPLLRALLPTTVFDGCCSLLGINDAIDELQPAEMRTAQPAQARGDVGSTALGASSSERGGGRADGGCKRGGRRGTDTVSSDDGRRRGDDGWTTVTRRSRHRSSPRTSDVEEERQGGLRQPISASNLRTQRP